MPFDISIEPVSPEYQVEVVYLHCSTDPRSKFQLLQIRFYLGLNFQCIVNAQQQPFFVSTYHCKQNVSYNSNLYLNFLA